MQKQKSKSPLERVLSNIHLASLAIGSFRVYGPKIRDKNEKPLLDGVDGVIVLDDDVMYEFTLAVKAYDSLRAGHRTRARFSHDLIHDSYNNIRSFYYGEEFYQIVDLNKPARRRAA